MKYHSKSEQDTLNFAAKFAETLDPGSIIALYGELGAGKTVFAKGLAKKLGIIEPIQSPTFVIACEYSIPLSSSKIRYLYHLDLYRIDGIYSAMAFGIEEYIQANCAVTLIEWPERINNILPQKTKKIEIKHRSENEREIIF